MSDDPEYDATVRHLVYVERYKADLARRIVAMVATLTDDVYGLVSTSELESLTPRQISKLLRQVEAMVATGYEPITEAVNAAVRDFGEYEAEWQSDMLARTGVVADLAVPSTADLWAAANARPFEGKLLADWLADADTNAADRVVRAIRQGYVDGTGSLEIAREIRGTKTRKGIMDISKNGAAAMARTAIANTAVVAKEQSYKSRRSIQEVQWVSVLDHRTTPICQARDGNIYPKGEGPRPPAHIGCRSTIIPVTRGNKEALKDRETYQDWLERQSAAVQNDILGPTRGKLYREGGYTVDRFVDKSGQEYTLDQLRAKDAATFQEVFAE